MHMQGDMSVSLSECLPSSTGGVISIEFDSRM
jgi:hypothetical protein